MNNYVLTRIEALQQELACLHQILVRQAKGEKATVELEGIWQGVEFNDSDFDLAKQSVFRGEEVCHSSWRDRISQ